MAFPFGMSTMKKADAISTVSVFELPYCRLGQATLT
jgi:hypothetical protein